MNMCQKKFLPRSIAVFILSLGILAGAFAQERPSLRLISSVQADFFGEPPSWGIIGKQTAIININRIFSLVPAFSIVRWADGVTAYKPALGAAFVITDGLYLDGAYALALGGLPLGHEATLALNWEGDSWYFALRETLNFRGTDFSGITYLYSSLSFPVGVSVSANAAVGLEPGASAAISTWGSAVWRLLPWLSPELGASAALQNGSFDWSLLAGAALNLKPAGITVRWEPRFGTKSGNSSLYCILDIRL